MSRKNPNTICSDQLAGVVGGLGPAVPAPKPDAGKAAVQRAYQQLEEVRALRNEASRLWWSGNPNDRSTAMFMLKRAGIPLN